MTQFYKGDPVETPLGPGRVAYQRMKADLSGAESVSVILHSRESDPSYSGTMFLVEQVQTLEAKHQQDWHMDGSPCEGAVECEARMDQCERDQARRRKSRSS